MGGGSNSLQYSIQCWYDLKLLKLPPQPENMNARHSPLESSKYQRLWYPSSQEPLSTGSRHNAKEIKRFIHNTGA